MLTKFLKKYVTPLLSLYHKVRCRIGQKKKKRRTNTMQYQTVDGLKLRSLNSMLSVLYKASKSYSLHLIQLGYKSSVKIDNKKLRLAM